MGNKRKLNMEKKEFDLKVRAQKLEETRFKQTHNLERDKLAFEEKKRLAENKLKQSENLREWIKMVILYMFLPGVFIVMGVSNGIDLFEMLKFLLNVTR